jgi:hypothetical protein
MQKEMKDHIPAIEKDWEIKDRYYHLTRNRAPLTYRMKPKHTQKRPCLWFDEELGYNRELRYATNQKSPFVDQQDGSVTLGHIVFEEGVLRVPKEKQALQKLLSLYHPNLGRTYKERDAIKEAASDVDILELQVEAMVLAKELEIEHVEAILRVEKGSKVSNMSSSELKRDILLFARSQPGLFIELVQDENVELRNFAIKAAEFNIIQLSQDQRTFSWASNGRKLMNVPFDENPYSAFAAYLKTDEGVEVYNSIQKKLK